MTPIRPTNLDIEILRSLIAVADKGSFAAAGKALGITQSAVTQQMHRLETNLNFPLFQKEGRNKVLNAQGRHLLGYARQLVLLHDEATQFSKRPASGVGILKIGTPNGVADNFLPRFLRQLKGYLPDVMVEIHVARSVFLAEDIKKGNLDLAISNHQNLELKNLPLYLSPIVWMCAADFPFSQDKPLPLILSDETSLYSKMMVEHLNAHRLAWRQAFMSPGVTGVLAALRAGLGITARNIELLTHDLRLLDEQDGLPPLPAVPYYLLSRPCAPNPLTEQVIEMFENNPKINNQVHSAHLLEHPAASLEMAFFRP